MDYVEKKKMLFKLHHEIILTNRLISKTSLINDSNLSNVNKNQDSEKDSETDSEKDSETDSETDSELNNMALQCVKQCKKNNNKYLKYYSDLSYNDKIDLIRNYTSKLNLRKTIISFIKENNIREIIEEEFNINFNIENLKKIDDDSLNNKISLFIDDILVKTNLEGKEDLKNYLNNMAFKKCKDIISDYVKNNTNMSHLDNEILLINKEIKENYIPLSNFKNININNFNLEHLLKKFNLLDLYYISFKINNYLSICSLSKSVVIKNISERYFNNILYYISEIKRENKNKSDEILEKFSDDFILLFECDIKVTILNVENINDESNFDLFNISSFTQKIKSYIQKMNFDETIKIYTILHPNDNHIFYSINYRECQNSMIKYLINIYETKKYIYIKNDTQLICDIDEYLVSYFCKNNYFHLFDGQLSTKNYSIKILRFLEKRIKTFPINYLINFIFRHNLFKFYEYYIHNETYLTENINSDDLNMMVREYYEKIFCKFVSEDLLSIYCYFTNKNKNESTNNVFFFQKLFKYINFKYNIHSDFSTPKYLKLEDCIDKVYERCEYDFFEELIGELLKVNFKFERESKYFRSHIIKTNIEDISLEVEENLNCPICYENLDSNNIIKFDCKHHVCNGCYEGMHKSRPAYNKCVCCLCRNNISEIYVKSV